MTKKEFYAYLADAVDIMIMILMFLLVKDILTGDVYDIIIDGSTVLVTIILENVSKFIIKINDDIED
jgi:hypothetical protein